MKKSEVIKDFLNNDERAILKMNSFKSIEENIIDESINFAYENPVTKIIVLNSTLKNYLINQIINKHGEKFSKQFLTSTIYTKSGFDSSKTLEGLSHIITLFLDEESVQKVINKGFSLYYRAFLPRGTNHYDISNMIDDKQIESTKQFKQPNELTKEDFKEAIRLALNEKSQNLLEIKVKDLNETPKVFYKGKEVNYENFVGVTYAFEFGDEEYEGAHRINLAFDNNGNIEAVQHGK